MSTDHTPAEGGQSRGGHIDYDALVDRMWQGLSEAWHAAEYPRREQAEAMADFAVAALRGGQP